jgi:hypothetical protein
MAAGRSPARAGTTCTSSGSHGTPIHPQMTRSPRQSTWWSMCFSGSRPPIQDVKGWLDRFEIVGGADLIENSAVAQGTGLIGSVSHSDWRAPDGLLASPRDRSGRNV